MPKGMVAFASMQWTGAKRDVHSWARERAQRVVLTWLGESTDGTQLRNGSELRLGMLPPAAASWADKVLCARAPKKRNPTCLGTSIAPAWDWLICRSMRFG